MNTSVRRTKAPRDKSPHVWEGADLFTWFRILAKGRAKVSPRFLGVALRTCVVSVVNSVLRWSQTGQYGDKIRETQIDKAPVFILGHWRSGTTLLHELMIMDDRHSSPNTWQCMSPHHFLITQTFAIECLAWLLPDRRPMDNMAAGWAKPQEDEFALAMLGMPSTYLNIAFPNADPIDADALDLENLPAWQLRAWKRALMLFLKAVTLRTPNRLILKSPTHTCRIPTLLEMFPDARFIHIVRDPYVVYPSTMHLWKSLSAKHGLQVGKHDGLQKRVIDTYLHMHERLASGRQLLAPNRFAEIRYEDLLADPIGQMGQLYGQLELGDFENIRHSLEAWHTGNTGYETNRYTVTPEETALVAEKWHETIARYGYDRTAKPTGKRTA